MKNILNAIKSVFRGFDNKLNQIEKSIPDKLSDLENDLFYSNITEQLHLTLSDLTEHDDGTWMFTYEYYSEHGFDYLEDPSKFNIVLSFSCNGTSYSYTQDDLNYYKSENGNYILDSYCRVEFITRLKLINVFTAYNDKLESFDLRIYLGEEKVIPSNAVEKMSGASATVDGKAGIVPAPKAGQQDFPLCGDGKYRALPQTDYTQNDETASDYLKNRPFYDYEDIVTNYSMAATKISDTELQLKITSEEIRSYLMDSSHINIAGKNYTVSYSINEMYGYITWNIGGVNYEGWTPTFKFSGNFPEDNYTAEFQSVVPKVKTIDEKYLPENLLTSVSYEEQNLTEEQQKQARNNIGVHRTHNRSIESKVSMDSYINFLYKEENKIYQLKSISALNMIYVLYGLKGTSAEYASILVENTYDKYLKEYKIREYYISNYTEVILSGGNYKYNLNEYELYIISDTSTLTEEYSSSFTSTGVYIKYIVSPSYASDYLNLKFVVYKYDKLDDYYLSSNIERTENRVTSIDDNASDSQYPSALAVKTELNKIVKPFVVTISKDSDGNITADKTFAEIKEANDAGMLIFAVYESTIYSLAGYAPDGIASFERNSGSSYMGFTCESFEGEDYWNYYEESLESLGIFGATAGQIPVISDVDENGYPTRWTSAPVVQSDYTQNDSTQTDYIKNRPGGYVATEDVKVFEIGGLSNSSGYEVESAFSTGDVVFTNNYQTIKCRLSVEFKDDVILTLSRRSINPGIIKESTVDTIFGNAKLIAPSSSSVEDTGEDIAIYKELDGINSSYSKGWYLFVRNVDPGLNVIATVLDKEPVRHYFDSDFIKWSDGKSVSYEEQELTDEQKAQARKNIEACDRTHRYEIVESLSNIYNDIDLLDSSSEYSIIGSIIQLKAIAKILMKNIIYTLTYGHAETYDSVLSVNTYDNNLNFDATYEYSTSDTGCSTISAIDANNYKCILKIRNVDCFEVYFIANTSTLTEEYSSSFSATGVYLKYLATPSYASQYLRIKFKVLQYYKLSDHYLDSAVERTKNKVTTIGDSATDDQYPSALSVKTELDKTVKTTEQALTDEQKTQARTNIGATDISLGLTGASAGQIIRIKSVDESGVPTEWINSDIDEKWIQLADVTLEEAVSTLSQTWVDTPMKKIRILLETVSATSNTNYMPVSVSTKAEEENIFNFFAAKFYPTALPMTSAKHVEYTAEMLKVGEYNAVRFTEYLGGIRGISSSENGGTFALDAEKSAVSTGNYGYSWGFNDAITGIRFSTYATFEAGTKFKIWGVAK